MASITSRDQENEPKEDKEKPAFPSQDGVVRRTDVWLRAIYPYLTTRILEIKPHQYVIAFNKDDLDADSIRQRFNEEIRPATLWCDVTNEEPKSFLREVSSIEDNQIARGFEGFPATFNDIRNILLSKFPDLPLPHHTPNQNNPIVIVFERPLTPEQELNVREVLGGIFPKWPIEIDAYPPVDEKVTAANLSGIDINVKPSRLRPAAPAFVKEDEAFWFNNIDRVFEGSLSPTSFKGTADAGMACYIDASVSKQIDLRQAILLYDTIYLTPPLSDGFDSPFWDHQFISREDVLELIEAGRLRLILKQPEERTDSKFLSGAYERSPSAVIGRLTAAAIFANDIVQTADSYLLTQRELAPLVGKLSKLLAAKNSLPLETMSQLLLWPLHARRYCLQGLMDRGLMGFSNISQGKILAEEIKASIGKDLELEALVTSDEVHIAHAFNATLIPPFEEMGGWILPRRIVGDRLNFYRGFTKETASAWAENERRKESRFRVLPPLPLFNFEKRAPISELIAFTSQPSLRRKGRALVTRLSELPIEEREAEIERLAQGLYEIGIRRARRDLHVDLASDSFDLVVEGLGQSVFPVRSAWSLLMHCLEFARRMPTLDALADTIEVNINSRLGRNSDLDFLSKVSRVAKIRDDS